LQPFTGNIRACEPGGTDLELEEMPDGRLVVHLRQGQIIWIIDGQHRRTAFQIVVEWLAEIVARGIYLARGGLYAPDREDFEMRTGEHEIWTLVHQEAVQRCTVDITVHLGLDIEQERQLFHDLNNFVKKPDKAIVQAFDQTNPVGRFVRNIIGGERLLGEVEILDRPGRGGRKLAHATDGKIMRDDLIITNAMLFAGQLTPAGISPRKVQSHLDYGRRFWRAVAKQPHFGTADWQEHTLLAQPVMIKALAQLAHAFYASREANLEHLETFLSALEAGRLDFAPSEPLWRTYLLPPAERFGDAGLAQYLTPEGVMAPYGVWDEEIQQLRFAINTRDVARYLGDLMRWKLGLPVRPSLMALKRKLEERTLKEAAE
jgi:hypothetical protein